MFPVRIPFLQGETPSSRAGKETLLRRLSCNRTPPCRIIWRPCRDSAGFFSLFFFFCGDVPTMTPQLWRLRSYPRWNTTVGIRRIYDLVPEMPTVTYLPYLFWFYYSNYSVTVTIKRLRGKNKNYHTCVLCIVHGYMSPFPLRNLCVISGVTASLNPEIPRVVNPARNQG